MTLAHLGSPYEGHNLANQNCRKLGIFDRKLMGSHSDYQDIDEYSKRKKGSNHIFLFSITSLGIIIIIHNIEITIQGATLKTSTVESA